MRTRPLAPVLSASLLLGACAPADPDDSDTATSTGEAGTSEGGGPAISEPPTLTEPCVGELQNPTRLAITTTDFSTGALSVLDLNTGEVKPDLALATTDSLPFYSDGRLVLLHRYTFDALDLLSPTSFALLGQQSLAVPGVLSSNPHAIAIAGDLAYVTLFGAPRVQIVDLADPSRPTLAGHIDLGPLADADGNPEAHLAIRCGDTLFVSLQRLDQNQLLAPTDTRDHLAAIDLPTRRLHDLDPDAPGVQPLPLRGLWAKQWRLDPTDPTGHTILVLTTGLERVDLATRTSTWAVDPARLAALGLDNYLLPQAFALDAAHAHAYIASYSADLSQVLLLRARLDDDSPIVQIAANLQSVGPTLEIVGDTLWFGDVTPTAAGMRAWDLRHDPPTPRFDGQPRATGLAPYAAALLP